MNVLIIDDEPVSRRILRRLLSRFPEFEMHEAEDGEAAWTLLGDVSPRLIFCDLSMPRMDGVAFLTKLRSNQAFGEMPVIVTSAGKDRDTLLQLKDLRILDYLLKPFELAPTFARLERLLAPIIAEDRAAVKARAEAAHAAQAVAKAEAAARADAATSEPAGAEGGAAAAAEARQEEPSASS